MGNKKRSFQLWLMPCLYDDGPNWSAKKVGRPAKAFTLRKRDKRLVRLYLALKPQITEKLD